MSETNTSASTSTSATVTGYDLFALADDVKKYNTDELISFLREQGLGLDEDDEEIICNEKIKGSNFLDLTLENLERWGMFEGPAKTLAKFVKIKKDFSEVLAKYGVEDERITNISQFTPKTHKIDDEDEELLHCLEAIQLNLSVMTRMESNSNEGLLRVYISPILHSCICIVRRHTGKNISLNPQFKVDGEEITGRIDYTIKAHTNKAIEKLICITVSKQHQIAFRFAQNVIKCKGANQTSKRKRKAEDTFDKEYDYPFGIVTTAMEWYFLLFTSDGISCTIRNPLNIRFVESAMEKGSEDEKELHKKVKEVMEVIVGLLMNSIDAEKELAMKKQRV